MSDAPQLRAAANVELPAGKSSQRWPAPADHVLLGLAALLGVTLIVFAFFPGIDLAVSRFFAPDGHFSPEVGLGRGGRDFFRVTPYVLLILLTLASLLRHFGLATPFAPSGRATLFLIAAMAIGPGLIVNLGLKDHAHRPRPINVVEFGGPNAFKPWTSSMAPAKSTARSPRAKPRRRSGWSRPPSSPRRPCAPPQSPRRSYSAPAPAFGELPTAAISLATSSSAGSSR